MIYVYDYTLTFFKNFMLIFLVQKMQWFYFVNVSQFLEVHVHPSNTKKQSA